MDDEMDDEPEHYDPLDGNLLPLAPELKSFVLQFMSKIRGLIATEKIGPGESIQASKALFALSRLPLTTPGMLLSVDATEAGEHGQLIFSATLTEDEFALTSIESSYGPYGSDRQSQVFLAAFPGSHLETDFEDPLIAAHEWLNRWAQLTREGRVSFSDEFDESGWYDVDNLSPSWDDLCPR
ncbi:MAG: hypothetical protein NXI32_12095 [bacterium]|nr:hypothetical protein [bacterium]